MINLRTALTAGLTQLITVAACSFTTGALLPKQFFKSYGWAVGPGFWMLCALASAHVAKIAPKIAVKAAAISGALSLIFVLAGLHTVGIPVAVIGFGLLCGLLAKQQVKT